MAIVPSEQKIRDYTARGWWGTLTLFDLFRRNAEATPDRIAVVDPPNRRDFTSGDPKHMTYLSLDDYVARLICAFAAFGLEQKDIVVVQLPNTVELAAVLLAAARSGIIVSPLPMQYGKHELSHVIRVLRPKAVITTDNFKADDYAAWVVDIADQQGCVKHVLVAQDDQLVDALGNKTKPSCAGDEPSSEGEADFGPVDANDIFSICWTSGTEAAPKGVPRTHNHWIALGKGVVENVGIEKDETLLNPFPLVNAAGIGSLLLPWLLTGGTLVQHHPFDAKLFVGQIRTEKVNYTAAAPAVLNTLLKDTSVGARESFKTLRRIGCGAAPLSPWMVREFEKEYGIPVINIMGSNEGILLISNPRDIADPEIRAQVFPRFGVQGIEWSSETAKWMETKLVDPKSGKEIGAAGVSGEIVIKGPMVFDGYYQNDDLNSKVFDDDGFFHTGDQMELVAIDNELRGYHFVGRLKEIIIRGGVNISPVEIEDLIVGHSSVKDVAVVGYPDDILGERACAVVVPVESTTITLDEINEYLRSMDIARYKLPERLLIVDELPRNALGKVARREISKLLT